MIIRTRSSSISREAIIIRRTRIKGWTIWTIRSLGCSSSSTSSFYNSCRHYL